MLQQTYQDTLIEWSYSIREITLLVAYASIHSNRSVIEEVITGQT